MASIEYEGLDELLHAFDRISDIPEDVQRKALTEMAELAKDFIKKEGETMGVRDDESSTHILDNIKLKKAVINKTNTLSYLDITFSGTRRRGKTKTRNATIAFVNEYGNRYQSARPFIGVAMTENADKITAAGADIIADWMEREFKK